jgi:serine/threonine protein kinase
MDALLYNCFILIENGTLFEFLIKNHDILTYQMIKQLIREIAEGINYLHENNIMHRDLKPENIMINESKEVKIVDLGFGKIIGKEQKIHERLGTLSYIAPEVYQSKGYNREADIWSLGLIVYYLLSGSIAFENGDQAVSFLEKANFDNEKLYSGLTNSNVSKNGRDLVMKCLNEQHKRINIKQFFI